LGETFEDPTSARAIPKIWKTLMMPGAGERTPLQVLEHVKILLQQGPRTRDLPVFRYMFPEIFPVMIPFPLHRFTQRWPEGIKPIDISIFNEVHQARYASVNMPREQKLFAKLDDYCFIEKLAHLRARETIITLVMADLTRRNQDTKDIEDNIESDNCPTMPEREFLRVLRYYGRKLFREIVLTRFPDTEEKMIKKISEQHDSRN
jgi:hypothetical protein